MNVSVDPGKVHRDAHQLAVSITNYGDDIGQALCLADWENDWQQKVYVRVIIAAHARLEIDRADPRGNMIVATVVDAVSGDRPYAVVDFRSEQDAMLFKLAQQQ